jgi:hypothetical protein
MKLNPLAALQHNHQLANSETSTLTTCNLFFRLEGSFARILAKSSCFRFEGNKLKRRPSSTH